MATILLKRSSDALRVPSNTDLSVGELSINTTDLILYTKTHGNAIKAIAKGDLFEIKNTGLFYASPSPGAENGVPTFRPIIQQDLPNNILYNNQLNSYSYNTQSYMNLKSYTESHSELTIINNVINIDLSLANYFYLNLNSNVNAMNITNVPSNVSSFTLEIIYDSTVRLFSWNNSIRFSDNSPPNMTNTNGKRDVFTFSTRDQGTYWIGYKPGKAYAS